MDHAHPCACPGDGSVLGAAAVRMHADPGVSRGAAAQIATSGKAGAGGASGDVPDAILITRRTLRASSAAAGLISLRLMTARLDLGVMMGGVR